MAENILDRCFEVAPPDSAWVTEITYVPTDEGWLYVAAVLDLFSRQVVGLAMSEWTDQRRVLDALDDAVRPRRPGSGLLHHSDRGTRGGFKWSSQHLMGGGCDDDAQAAMLGSSWAWQVAIARQALGGTE